MFSRHLCILLTSLALIATSSHAQESTKTILVLDASGSMWGQIDGKTKIEIAQTVVGGLLDDLPENQVLGLTAYGHNRKGDCSDIETLVEPGTATRDAIRSAVNAIKPKGKTPLSEAVIRAAEALKYTEDKATVILISDGRETCDFDPCEVGRKLEESGVDFTAHVVGFDVANPADRAQLQCLAENTGGQFITASNASELTTALQKVSVPEPPKPLDITFAAILEGTTTRVTENLVWSLTNTDDGTTIADYEAAVSLTQSLMPGTYKAEVLRTSDEATAETTLTVTSNTSTTVLLELPVYLPKATVTVVPEAPAGSSIQVTWTGPAENGDYIGISEIGSRPRKWINYVNASKGSPSLLLMPPKPGDYEVRYTWQGKVLAKAMIKATPVTATVTAAQEASAGSKIPVEWTGPDYKNDHITVAEIGSRNNKYVKYTYTREGSPLSLQMPVEPGDYEIRYVMSQKNTVLAKQSIKVSKVLAEIIAPDTASAGADLVVDWKGPDYKNDYISVAKIGDKDGRYVNYSYTRHGSPLKLQMPPEAGDYEIRYVVNQGNTVLARKPISVSATNVTITAPATAAAGAPVVIQWDGPDYKNDYIAVAEKGAKGGKYINYTYTKHGNPLRLQMPPEAGDYEIRYIQNQDNTILATVLITVEALAVRLTIPQTAKAGEALLVQWNGPDYQNDYISIAKPDTKGGKYIAYTYTKQGSPLRLKMPLKAGDYEVRYIQNQDNTILASQSISVESVGATLSAADTALSGEPLLIQWEGPDYKNDYISVAELGSKDNKYVNYTYTRDGSPLRVRMPAKAGDYEIRYVAQGSPDTVITRRTVSISMAEASVELAGEAIGGQAALITWTGPDFAGDYIAVSKIGDPRYEKYTLTNDGSPLRLKMPERPGQYELRYFLREKDTIIARQTIEVK